MVISVVEMKKKLNFEMGIAEFEVKMKMKMQNSLERERRVKRKGRSTNVASFSLLKNFLIIIIPFFYLFKVKYELPN